MRAPAAARRARLARLAVLRGAPSRPCASGSIAFVGLARTATTIDHDDVDAACRQSRARAWARPACWTRAVAPADGDASGDRFALGLPGARDARLARRACRFRLRHAGPRLRRRSPSPARRELKRAVLPKTALGRMARRFRACPRRRPAPTSRRWPARRAPRATITCSTARRRGSRTAASPTSIVVFARTGEAPGARGISAFVVFPDDPGFSIAERIEVIAPHPLATLRFENCRIPARRRLGAPGGGFKIAMQTLDIFRASVAAAALGFARRALRRSARACAQRRMFGATLGDLQLTPGRARRNGDRRSTPPRC